MGAVRTMNRRRIERERRLWVAKRTAKFESSLARAWQRKAFELQALLNDPEGTIQRGINERYVADMRQRELEHHASWDAEVLVHKRAAARWMRSAVLELVTDEAVRVAIEALPLVPGDA